MAHHEIEAVATKATVAAMTTGAGLASYLQVIQGILGVIATLAGIVLTSMLIYKEVTRIRSQAKRHKRRYDDDREL